jgi:hypothetical protein
MLVVAVAIHVGALWMTSATDVIDASPTPFSAWGVIAMCATFTTPLMVALRRRLPWRPRTWHTADTFLAVIIVVGSVAHALLI